MSVHRMHLVETGPSARTAWPSIASASAELRRPRHLHAVPARAENPAVLGRVAPQPPSEPADRRWA